MPTKTTITIKNHKTLKERLEKALADYATLPKNRFSFLAPGDEGRARAAYLKKALTTIEDSNSQQLEIIFAAIVQSKIFASTCGRLKELLLTHLIRAKNDITLDEYGPSSKKPAFTLRADQLYQNLKLDNIFSNLELLAETTITQYERLEGASDHSHYCFTLSRTNALTNAAAAILQAHKEAVTTEIKAINDALENEKKSQKEAAATEMEMAPIL